MKRYYNESVENLLNELMNFCFYCNLVADDIAYQLQTVMDLDQTGEVYHLNFAHWFTGDSAADLISDIMIKSNIMPKRSSLTKPEKTYAGIIEVFEENVKLFEDLRNKTIQIIDALEYDINNKQLTIQLEDFLVSVADMLRKSNVILGKATAYANDGKTYRFEKWFADFMG